MTNRAFPAEPLAAADRSAKPPGHVGARCLILAALLAVLSFLAAQAAQAAEPTTDELRARLEKTSGRPRVDLLNDLSKSRWGASSDETIAWADQAIELAHKIVYPAGEACGLRYKGVGYWYKDDYTNALDYCLRALALYERIGDRQGMTACRSTIGTIYLNLDRFDEALATYQAALPIAEQAGDQPRVGILESNIGTTLLGMKKPAEALVHFERARAILEKHGSQLDVLTALGNIAGSHRRLGHFREALGINETILDLATKAGSKVRQVDAMTDTGQILDEMGRPDEALPWLERALAFAAKEDLKRNLADGELALVGHFEKQGDFRNALAHQKRFGEIRGAMVSEENTKARAELQVKYESEKKEKQIQTQKLEIERQRNTRNLLVALSLLVVVLLVATHGRYRAKKREADLLDRLSRTDPLTGLANRRALMESLENELHRVRRDGTALSIVLADVDHFKKFNDRHGHDTGDEVLKAVARAFREGVREVDLVARWGGEEFLAILPGADREEATRIATRVQERIRDASIEREGEPLRVTATFGVSPFVPGEPLGDCIKRADLALYRGKEAGRNRIVVQTRENAPNAESAA